MPYVVLPQQASQLQDWLTPRGPAGARWRLHSVRVGGTRVHAFFQREATEDAPVELQLHHPEAPGVRPLARSEQFLLVGRAPQAGELAGALATALRAREHEWAWTWMDPHDEWLRVPLPAWMASWPMGLRPIVLQVHDGILELTYPGRVRVSVQVAPTLRVAVGARSEAAARLRYALLQRLSGSAEARRWLAALARRSSPADAVRRALLRDADPEALGRALGRALDPAIGAWLSLARERVDTYMSLHSSYEARPPAPDPGPWALAVDALHAGFTGRRLAARAAARALADRVVDPRHHHACGALLLLLDDPESAFRPLAYAYHGAGLGAPQLLSAAVSTGRADVARELVARALAGPEAIEPEMLALHVDQLLRVDAADAAERALQQLRRRPDAPAIATRLLAELCLYRGRLDEAEALAREVLGSPPDPAAARVLVGVDVLRGRPEAALARADALPDDARARDPQLLVWTAEARLRQGHALAARDDVLRAPLSSHVAVHLIEGMAELALGGLRDDNRAVYPRVVRDLLDMPQDTDVISSRAPGERALRRLGGNRGEPLTRVTEAGALRRYAPPSPRTRYEQLQRELLRRPHADVLAEFEALQAAQPDLPYPLTYGAELMLWLGRYEQAQVWLERAWERFETRWGYVGAGAAAYLRGQPDRALEWWARGAARFGLLAAEATHAYRGEVWRVMGETERAIEALEHATLRRPTRVGAWIHLALAYLERDREGDGRRDRQRVTEILTTLGRLAPALVWEACRAVDVRPRVTLVADDARAPLQRAALMLRGNRSSRLLTFFDAAGELRVFDEQHHERFTAYARDALALPHDALVRDTLGLESAT